MVFVFVFFFLSFLFSLSLYFFKRTQADDSPEVRDESRWKHHPCPQVNHFCNLLTSLSAFTFN